MSPVAVKLQVVPVGGVPFEGDLFDRKLVSERLRKVIDMLPEGGAIAIDAPWGSGKTWFAKNWMLELDRDGHEVIYVDAFASDYVDDPFLMLAGELVSAAKRQQSTTANSIVEAGARVGKAILPATAKFVVSAAGKWIAGETASDKLVESLGDAVEGAGEMLEKQIKKKLADYEAEKQSVVAFRESLASFTATRTTPIVVLIDELDRCRPDFALRTIERIKHFFEVPKLVFVLLFNRSQLCASIQGAYGPNFDADGYLRKFLLFSLMLPKIHAQSSSDHNVRYCLQVLRAYGFPDSQSNLSFAEQFGVLTSAIGLSLRDLERGVALYALGQPINNSSTLVAWVIALKLWRPDLYQRILRDDAVAHREVFMLAKDGLFKESFIVPHALKLHEFHGNGAVKGSLATGTIEQLQMMFPSLPYDKVLKHLLSKIDLPVS